MTAKGQTNEAGDYRGQGAWSQASAVIVFMRREGVNLNCRAGFGA